MSRVELRYQAHTLYSIFLAKRRQAIVIFRY